MGSTKDAKLSHSLEHGLGFLHETMSQVDQDLVASYFSSGAIQACSALHSSVCTTLRLPYTECNTRDSAPAEPGPPARDQVQADQDLVASYFSSSAIQAAF